jgi:ABC-type nitrate/sulfonate/bicarbonate transport system permease component
VKVNAVNSSSRLRTILASRSVQRIMSVLHALIGPSILIILWWFAAEGDWVSRTLLPGPIETFASFGKNILNGEMLHDSYFTLYRTAYAFFLATVIAVPLGIILGANTKVYRSFEVVIEFFRSTPATAIFPLFLLLFGIGDFAKISVAAFAAGLVILFNVAYGVMNARQTRIQAARVMGASRPRVLMDVLFFESLTSTFVGLRMGVSIALVVVIVAEMFIGTNDGLGHRIIDAQQIYDLEDMYASILATGAMGYGFNLLFLGLEKWLVHWSGR